jgi:hypothetical protein
MSSSLPLAGALLNKWESVFEMTDSLPPCGGGLGWGVEFREIPIRYFILFVNKFL